MARSDEAKYKLHSDEYMEFVRTNKRLPNEDDRFSTGTKMMNWRRYAKTIVQDQNIIMFDESMKEEFNNVKKARKTQLDYDKMTSHMRREGDPQTLEEYLVGNNRYHYFDILAYIEIMRILASPSKEELILMCRLKLLLSVYHCNMFTWDEFHNEYDLTSIGDDIMKVVNSLSDRERMVISYKYGLDTGSLMSDSEIASIFYISSERIRVILAKALRRLAHPNKFGWLRKYHKTLIDRNIPAPRIVNDHCFYIFIYNKSSVEYETFIHRPIHELDEALMEICEGSDADMIDPKSEYKLRSVKTYVRYAYTMNDKIVKNMHIPPEDIAGNVAYQYTKIIIDIKPTISTEEYIKCQLLAQQDKIEAEEINNDFQQMKESITSGVKEYIKEQKNLRFLIDNFESLFSVACSRICTTIEFDDEYAWISEFNKKIREYDIPVNCVKDSAEILRKVLCGYIDDFVFSCKYLPKGIHYYYMHIEMVD